MNGQFIVCFHNDYCAAFFQLHKLFNVGRLHDDNTTVMASLALLLFKCYGCAINCCISMAVVQGVQHSKMPS